MFPYRDTSTPAVDAATGLPILHDYTARVESIWMKMVRKLIGPSSEGGWNLAGDVFGGWGKWCFDFFLGQIRCFHISTASIMFS